MLQELCPFSAVWTLLRLGTFNSAFLVYTMLAKMIFSAITHVNLTIRPSEFSVIGFPGHLSSSAFQRYSYMARGRRPVQVSPSVLVYHNRAALQEIGITVSEEWDTYTWQGGVSALLVHSRPLSSPLFRTKISKMGSPVTLDLPSVSSPDSSTMYCRADGLGGLGGLLELVRVLLRLDAVEDVFLVDCGRVRGGCEGLCHG